MEGVSGGAGFAVINWCHVDHPERAQHAIMLADRDILAGPEHVGIELEERLVGFAVTAIFEAPAMPEMMEQATLNRLVAPEPAHAAFLLHMTPGVGIDMALGVQRRHELVTVLCTSLRKVGGAREFESDVGKNRHGNLLSCSLRDPSADRSNASERQEGNPAKQRRWSRRREGFRAGGCARTRPSPKARRISRPPRAGMR